MRALIKTCTDTEMATTEVIIWVSNTECCRNDHRPPASCARGFCEAYMFAAVMTAMDKRAYSRGYSNYW